METQNEDFAPIPLHKFVELPPKPEYKNEEEKAERGVTHIDHSFDHSVDFSVF